MLENMKAETLVDREDFENEKQALKEIHELVNNVPEAGYYGVKMYLMGVLFGSEVSKKAM